MSETSDRYPGFLSVKEFCARNSLSRWTLAALVEANEIPHAKAGRKVLIPEDGMRYLMDRSGWTRKDGA